MKPLYLLLNSKHSWYHVCIVLVLHFTGKAGLYNLGGYAASKHAIECFSDVLAQELYKWGVDVSVVEPGPYKTGNVQLLGFESDTMCKILQCSQQLLDTDFCETNFQNSLSVL